MGYESGIIDANKFVNDNIDDDINNDDGINNNIPDPFGIENANMDVGCEHDFGEDLESPPRTMDHVKDDNDTLSLWSAL